MASNYLPRKRNGNVYRIHILREIYWAEMCRRKFENGHLLSECRFVQIIALTVAFSWQGHEIHLLYHQNQQLVVWLKSWECCLRFFRKHRPDMGNFVYFLLIASFYFTRQSEAALIIFTFDSGGTEVAGIRNCSCALGSPTCTSTQLLNSPFCTCNSFTVSEISTSAANVANSVSWWNTDPMTICCESASSTTANQLLDNLMDYSRTSELTLDHCQGLVPSTDQHYTIYGLEEIRVITDTNANYPSQDLIMIDTDHALTNQRSREFRDYHIAFVDKSLLNGDSEMKAWSVWAFPEDADSDYLRTAIDRAPSTILAKSDGMIMFTPIYD